MSCETPLVPADIHALESRTPVMKRIILFRFHHQFDVCLNHLEILRIFNPGVPIYGLFGGTKKDFVSAKALPLQHVWEVPLDDASWKWVNGDLCIRWWFREFGSRLDFDMLHLCAWDMILLQSVERQFHHVRKGVAITGIRPLNEVIDTWYWTAPRRGRGEWRHLIEHVTRAYGYNGDPVAGCYGGACLSRGFLTRYAKTEVPSWCNDEVRTALFAQAFKMPVTDTNLLSSCFSADRRKPISADMVYEHYRAGIRAFHPVRETLDIGRILEIMQSLSLSRPVNSAE